MTRVMKISAAWRILFTFQAAASVITIKRDNITLAASSGNLTSSNSLVPCCVGRGGGYGFNGFYESTRELDETNDVYLRQVADLLGPYGATHTVRGSEDVGHLEAYGEVTVTLRWIMDPPGSATLTYAQTKEALGHLLDVIDGDIYAPEAVDHEVALIISVGSDKKILVYVTSENGDQFHSEAGHNLEVNCQTYDTRPISRSDTAASLAAATAQYNQHPAAAVPDGFAQTITQGGVRFKMLLGLGELEVQWPHFTFADLVGVADALQGVLERADAPSADTWGALFASIETQEESITVGFVRFEAVMPGTHLLTAENSTQAIISRPGNSSAASQVDVT